MKSIEDLKALEQAATEGPWIVGVDGIECPSDVPGIPNFISFDEYGAEDPDQILIVTLRNLAPEIIGILEAINQPVHDPEEWVDAVLDAEEKFQIKLESLK